MNALPQKSDFVLIEGRRDSEAPNDPQRLIDELLAIRAIIDRAVERLQAARQSPQAPENSPER